MFYFTREQEEVDIGGLVIGGQPGENPTALFGTVFYGKGFKKLDEDALKRGKNLIKEQEELQDKTGVSAIPDAYIKDESNVEDVIDAVIDATDGPFAIDSSEAGARALALKIADDRGVLNRVIYNSINLGITDMEVKALKYHTPNAAIVLAYNPRDYSVDGRAKMLQTGVGMLQTGDEGLIELAERVGIDGLLIDTGATPFGNMSAETIRAMPVFKNLFGKPVGCSIHNTLESWGWMKDLRADSEQDYQCANACANGLVPLYGGDFIVYGPIAEAKRIFPSIAFVDKLVAEGSADYFNAKISENHPYNKLK